MIYLPFQGECPMTFGTQVFLRMVEMWSAIGLEQMGETAAIRIMKAMVGSRS